MKNYIYILMFATFLFASCHKPDEVNNIAGDEITVNYSINVAPATKSQDYAGEANYVWYALYKKSVDELGAETYTLAREYAVPEALIDGKAVCPVTMMRDQSYKIVFVAQHYEVDTDGEEFVYHPTYVTDAEAHTVTMPAAAVANSLEYDAFYAADDVEMYDGQTVEPVTLSRFVAKVTFLPTAEDIEAARTLSMAPTHSSMAVEGLSKTLDLLTGKPSQDVQTVEYSRAEILAPATGEEANIGTFYGFASDVVKISLDLYNVPQGATAGEIGASQSVRKIEVGNVPMKSNMKTNIRGRMMTGTLDYQITLDTDSSTQDHPID